jgi:parallel beta-helix repeat protein
MDGKYRRASSCWTRIASFSSVLLLFVPSLMAVDLSIVTLGTSFYRTVDPGFPLTIQYQILHRTVEPLTATVTVALPAGARFERALESAWSCTASTDAVSCARELPGSGYYALTVVILAPPSLDGYVIDEGARVTSSLPDANESDNFTRFQMTGYRTREVTTADDDGEGSLRAALAWAHEQNDPVLPYKIRFAAPMIIEPLTPLPEIRACRLVIDGGTFADDPLETAHFDRPRRVEIRGDRVPFGSGITVTAPCTRGGGALSLRGLAVNGFPENGIEFAAGTGMVSVFGCFVGTDASGLVARPNGLRGIALASSEANAALEQNIVSGNRYSGIAAWDVGTLDVRRNWIGISASETPLPNGSSGIFINAGALDSSLNLIMNNRHFGIGVGAGAQHAISFDDRFRDNAGNAVDWGLDGPTAVDATGRMPPVPRIVSAVYNLVPNLTIVRATIETPDGAHPALYGVRVTWLDHGETRGWWAGELVSFPLSGPWTYEFRFLGDLRGSKLAAQTLRGAKLNDPLTDSSEISEPFEVR